MPNKRKKKRVKTYEKTKQKGQQSCSHCICGLYCRRTCHQPIYGGEYMDISYAVGGDHDRDDVYHVVAVSIANETGTI